jgi:hypothetical protein
MKAPNLFATLLLSAALPLGAQVLEPQATGGTDNTTVINQREDKGDKPFLGNDVPMFDPESEMLKFDGQSWNIADNRVVRARFEKYLNAPESSDEADQAYRTVLAAILDKLSPNHGGIPDLQGAVALLPTASEHPIDAHLCDAISQAVYGAYLSQKNVSRLDSMNGDLKKEAERLHWNVEQSSQGSALSNNKTSTTTKTGKNAQTTNSGDVTSAGRTTGYALRLIEIEALKKANAAKMGISTTQAKIEFQGLILQFLMQRRFEHVVIGARLYRRIFADGENTINLKEGSDVSRMFGEGLGTNPTLSMLESVANEAMRDVDEGVQAFEFLLEKDELESASKRLSEAFFIGEYLPRIRTLERDKKRQVLSFVRDAYQLKSAMEVRDYGLGRELVDRMREEAKDFDYSKARASIEFHTSLSDAHIAKAKLAAQSQDMDTYSKEMQIAIEAWPQNPNIKTLGETVNTITDSKIQALNDFDRLLAQKDYRQIAADQGRFIAASAGDSKRQEQLQKVADDMKSIEMALAKSNALAEGGNKWGAWESAQEILKQVPQDPVLNQTARELNTEVAEFVSVLKRASRLEADDQVGSGLAWYLKARSIYPNSILAREGIDRLIADYFPNGSGPASGSPALDNGSPLFDPTGASASSQTNPNDLDSGLNFN